MYIEISRNQYLHSEGKQEVEEDDRQTNLTIYLYMMCCLVVAAAASSIDLSIHPSAATNNPHTT